jgi:hypothetical protein
MSCPQRPVKEYEQLADGEPLRSERSRRRQKCKLIVTLVWLSALDGFGERAWDFSCPRRRAE